MHFIYPFIHSFEKEGNIDLLFHVFMHCFLCVPSSGIKPATLAYRLTL